MTITVRVIPNPQELLRAGELAAAVDAFRQHWRNRIAAEELLADMAKGLGCEPPPRAKVEPLPWLEYA